MASQHSRSPSRCSKLARVAAAAVLLMGAAATAQDLTVRIGHVAPLSGQLANVGWASESGVRLALEELNARGVTIGGRKARFELLAEDDGADANRAADVARKLVAAGVHGVVGHLTSDTTIAAAKVYAEGGIPQVSPSATSPAVTAQGLRTTFRVIVNEHQGTGVLGRYAIDTMKASRFIVVDDGSAYGRDLVAEFSKAVLAGGGTVLEARSTTRYAPDADQIAEAAKARNAEVVFFGGLTYGAGPIIAQLKKSGVQARVMAGDGACHDDLVSRWAGVSVEQGEVICASPGAAEGADDPAVGRFRAAYERRFGKKPRYYEPYAYDAAMVMVDAMVRAGSIEPARYLPVLAKTDGYGGVTGTIAFDARGDVKNGAVTLHTYKGQEKVAVGIAR